MLFEFDSDQRLWQETVRDVVAKECPAALVRGVADDGVDPAPLWRTLVAQGWTELTEPGEVVELAIVLEELGRAADPTPYLATTTWFTPLAPGVLAEGEVGTAVFEGVTATPDGDGWVLDGHAPYVLDADRADRLAVVTDAGVFVVPAAAAVIARAEVFDPVVHLASVTLSQVRVTERVDADVERARHTALTGLAVTMVGACRRILDMTLEHVRNRSQFGVLIGSFQAVKHKAVDMHVAVERARALAYFAALTIAEDDPRRAEAASMAKAAAGECQSLVVGHGIQLHGAMGFTWENDLQFAVKRAKTHELLLGTAEEHRATITEARCG